ncbi:CDP-alcohol phosphatidyltransferase family protein [Shewanella sp. D64]|uniref:CDP-alcohol phosphatidyltransferase family protein n=1 Tax=unclassified Shewanella TaxID=196818 RepID=UPI0022BA7119|nr:MULTISPECIES: CDP-alcohol phosphatidyltransferase family protein [unclassified Shewanella]MEC4727907.1 CDP-alcohol phosphatidyltransferase family protein [Shewanella sp. D64]MEC4739949.1 CDP-alcohol phosphatidyltransferase family protein [Shewanella sp. E94]WBJ97089.1 CDP-alcohol phosphatidyltransferase family protein [Shewanella sp. MTB7]
MNLKLAKLWATKTKNDEWWSSFVTSPLAIVLNYFVVDIKWFTPNKITVISFITAIIAAVFILLGGVQNFIIAAILIHLSHVFDCMDGQMARYRKTSSVSGSYYDKLTDQIQVFIWFSAIAYAAFQQSGSVIPVFLALFGIAFYSLRGYSKYVTIYLEASQTKDSTQDDTPKEVIADTAGIEFGLMANIRWFLKEQKKIFSFDEGVFIFMLSLALILNMLTPMLWVFALSQVFYGLLRAWQRGVKLDRKQAMTIGK